MSTQSEKDREKLKEEYKEHYRKIRETKEKLRRNKYVQNINQAFHQLNRDELLETMDDFLHQIRSKVANFESRLDVALDHLMEERSDQVKMEEFDAQLKKERAKETLRQVREEMGILYSEIEKRAENMNVKKSIGLASFKKEESTGRDNDTNPQD